MLAIREQVERLSRCRISINIHGSRDAFANQNIVDGGIFAMPEAEQGSMFIETIRLSPSFFAELKRHPVPLKEAAISQIANNSMALDLYAWLAYRLHVLKGPTPVSWSALRAQFGTGFKAMNHFRATFLSNLRLALSVYREAKVEETERGVTLMSSPPPVAPRMITVGKVHTPTPAPKLIGH